MSRKRPQRSFGNFFSKQLLFFSVGIVSLSLLAFPVYKKIKKQNELGGEITNLQTEINRLKEKNSDLNQVISYLESDDFVEKEARKKLNYKKEGEEMVIIKNEEALRSSNQINDIHNNEKYSKPQKWLRYFFN